MPDPRWERVREIVADALELDPWQREEFIEQACRGDAQLLDEVRALVEGADETNGSGFLEPPELPPHTTLGEFELQRVLGRGGMAIVYLAWQPSLKRQVAVKVLEATVTTRPTLVERFHREARAIAKLQHPGIVPVYADGTDGAAHWFAMEYVEGHDVAREVELWREHPTAPHVDALLPGPSEAGHLVAIATLCADVADALQEAHAHGLVHRDVKPKNLLLRPGGRVQVADFGLVRDESLGSLTKSEELAGTLPYMSPEQAHVRKAEVDHRTDVYSLGVVLYELCTLRRPFRGSTSAELLRKIERSEPPPPRRIDSRIPRDLAVICATAMEKDPQRRYPDAGAFAEDLRRFVNHEPIVARPPSLARRGARLARRHAAVLSATTLLVLGLLFGSWWTNHAALAASRARLTVRVVDARGEELSGDVLFRRLDLVTGQPSEDSDVHALPLDRLALAAGYGRIVADIDGWGVRECVRMLEPGRTTELVIEVGEHQRGTAGMVRLDGGTLALADQDEGASDLMLQGETIALDPFWIDDHEVSIREYRQFLEATRRAPPKHWDLIEPGVHDDLPVVMVSWEDARAYAEWRGKRLPSFAEWTWAARGAEGRIYPWPNAVRGEYRGNTLHPSVDPGQTRAGVQLALSATTAVRPRESDGDSPDGVHHLLGNVAEWTDSILMDGRTGEMLPLEQYRVVAGHQWDAGHRGPGQTLIKYSFEHRLSGEADFRLGFRCIRSASP